MEMKDTRQELTALKRTIHRLRTLHLSPRPTCKRSLLCDCELATDIRTLGDIWRRLDDEADDEADGEPPHTDTTHGTLNRLEGIFEHGIERVVAAIDRGNSL